MLGLRFALWALAAAFLLFLVVDWGTSVSIPPKCEQYDGDSNEHSEPKQCTSLRSTVFEGAEPIVYRTARWFDVHNGTVTGIATIFLAIITALLVSVARDQSKTTRAQLRAYVFIRPAGLRNISPTENFHFSFVQLNGGQTPAYSVSQSGNLLLVNHPLPENFPFPELPLTHESKIMVAPNTPFTGHLLATQRFTKDEIIEILEGKATGGKRLYIFGQIDYVDAFKKPHWTRYCLSFPGWHDAVAPASRDQWSGIATILDQRGVAFNFEFAHQHNVTDDG